jgi:hypothetical protein
MLYNSVTKGDGDPMKKIVKEIEQTAIERIAQSIGDFSEQFSSRITSSSKGVLDAIESDWVELCGRTDKAYQQMVSELTDSVDESDMIAKKKRNGLNVE